MRQLYLLLVILLFPSILLGTSSSSTFSSRLGYLSSGDDIYGGIFLSSSYNNELEDFLLDRLYSSVKRVSTNLEVLDNLTISLDIKENLYFNNGEKIDASSIKSLITDMSTSDRLLSSYWGKLQIIANGDKVIIKRLEKNISPSYISSILNLHVYSRDFSTDLSKEDITNIFGDRGELYRTTEGETLVLKLEKVELILHPYPTVVELANSFKSDDIDIVLENLYSTEDTFGGRPRQILDEEKLEVLSLVINPTSRTFSNRDIRRGLSYALDDSYYYPDNKELDIFKNGLSLSMFSYNYPTEYRDRKELRFSPSTENFTSRLRARQCNFSKRPNTPQNFSSPLPPTENRVARAVEPSNFIGNCDNINRGTLQVRLTAGRSILYNNGFGRSFSRVKLLLPSWYNIKTSNSGILWEYVENLKSLGIRDVEVIVSKNRRDFEKRLHRGNFDIAVVRGIPFKDDWKIVVCSSSSFNSCMPTILPRHLQKISRSYELEKDLKIKAFQKNFFSRNLEWEFLFLPLVVKPQMFITK
ncbi:MAG: hypothetical protein JJV93_01315 [Alphaproteobacteria bacterium]|nr:hypothetical protein [Alphaproteobacteria bacterium]MBL0717889.1 hypothetical protein [Alphaproteobacteria bacterium]